MDMNDYTVRAHLHVLLNGGNAHKTLDRAVKDFPEELINVYPAGLSYTFWHLLEHIRIAQWDILEFIKDPSFISPQWPEGYWPKPDQIADKTMWDKTLQDYYKDHDALVHILNEEETDLYNSIKEGTDFTILREILIVADHTSYHLGQFSILRQIAEKQKK